MKSERTSITQYSNAWHADRVGRITASVWRDLNSAPSTAKYKNAVNNLIYERLTGHAANADQPKTFYMERGNEREAAAAERFGREMFFEIERGAWYRLGDFAGASPDGVIKGENLGLEIKYPKESTQIAYLRDALELREDYRDQCYFQMYVCGFDGVWLVSDNVHTPQVRIFIPRDEDAIEKIAAKLEMFNDLILRECNKIKNRP